MGFFDKLSPSKWKKKLKSSVQDAVEELAEVAEKEFNEVIAEVKKVGEWSKMNVKNWGEAKVDDIKRWSDAGIDRIKTWRDAAISKIKGAGEVAVEEVKDAAEEAKDFFKKLGKSGAPEVLLDCALPTSCSISGQIVGNGVSATWSDNEEVAKKAIHGKLTLDDMYEFLPDEISVEFGLELALVVSVDVGISATYNSKEDIEKIVKWFKDNT